MSLSFHAGTRGKKGAFQAAKPYLFLLPMLVFAAGFVYYPFLKTCLQSVSIVNFRGEITGFAGFDNYLYLFGRRREFGIALENTFKLTLINVPVTVVLTLLLGYICCRPHPFHRAYETMFALPMVVSMAAISLIFKVLFNPSVGFVNYALGIQSGWYEDRHTAMGGILMLTVWMGVGFNFLLFLSAFRAVPKDALGCAKLDGAGPLRILLKIQLPLISPTILYVVCTNLILAMMTSGPILILTQGGPSRSTMTLIFFMYTSGYNSSNYSLAACVSVVTFLLTFLFTFLLFTMEKRKVHYQ
ncbi:MAG: sugar ABC transporter permease [Clostridia bacterium]|nr:sugar ABC transporter permease [Clostridia bacterium]